MLSLGWLFSVPMPPAGRHHSSCMESQGDSCAHQSPLVKQEVGPELSSQVLKADRRYWCYCLWMGRWGSRKMSSKWSVWNGNCAVLYHWRWQSLQTFWKGRGVLSLVHWPESNFVHFLKPAGTQPALHFQLLMVVTVSTAVCNLGGNWGNVV